VHQMQAQGTVRKAAAVVHLMQHEAQQPTMWGVWVFVMLCVRRRRVGEESACSAVQVGCVTSWQLHTFWCAGAAATAAL
jgi:hypothetical protein